MRYRQGTPVCYITSLLPAKSRLELLCSGNVYKRNYDALDYVRHGAVRHDPHRVPVAIYSRNLLLGEHQGAQGVLGVGMQLRIDQGAGQVAKRPPDVALA